MSIREKKMKNVNKIKIGTFTFLRFQDIDLIIVSAFSMKATECT